MEKTLNVKGMTCGHCKQSVTNALQELNGVDQVEVNLDEGTAKVSYEDSKVTVAQMREAVEGQGYDVV
ncbi:copper chaperone CopZ [Alkalihalobacillus sp. AL-G]|uniref:copper chaperone CopZ n=1 Tax=Alkalihalobacillus sp. AL-G TaxID=2926399 RepID=UPI00272AE20E|nr:copper chaperone CopZ [Alkalihalobacillus sp. AL-G]WLD94798.1 copper chaperone CopZ [Alkalihalobacillus sp. AL-G]